MFGAPVHRPRHDRACGRFIKDGRLVIVPTKRSKLRLVLDHIAQDFEPGRKYAEPEVNEVLRALPRRLRRAAPLPRRRGVPEREGGVYWRAGGTVEV